MRRLGALGLAVVAYSLMALLSAEASTIPAGAALCASAFLLVRAPEPRDDAERIALELVRGR
jgi:hypothetical protein